VYLQNASTAPPRQAAVDASIVSEACRAQARPALPSSSMDPVNLEESLALFSDYWQPRSVGQFNGHDLLLAKALGEFVWHKHDDTDDFFLVVKGTLVIEMRDRNVTLRAGELFVVPKGVEHRPVAREEVHVLVIEPLGTPNTGDSTTAAPPRTI
jgi:mannose-6-phosphate isomerase-like protein (cupin superfamily)